MKPTEDDLKNLHEEALKFQGWCEALESVVASLKGYPHHGGHVDIIREVQRIEREARKPHTVSDQTILLEVADGPEGIKIYTSEDKGVVDWSNTFPAVYLEASVNGASVKLGPFQCLNIYNQLQNILKPLITVRNNE